jgi:hypothetical protein
MTHPLIKAIELKEQALKNKADKKIIDMLQKRIDEEAEKSSKILGDVDKWIKDIKEL